MPRKAEAKTIGNFYRYRILTVNSYLMKITTHFALFLILGTGWASPQTTPQGAMKSKTPVYISHNGDDEIGKQFFSLLKQELARSHKYKLGASGDDERQFRFYIELLTMEVPSNEQRSAVASLASVVIEDMAFPGSYPVPFKWYHKAFLLEGKRLPQIAAEFIADMDAHWCNTIKNSEGNCPRELLSPIYRPARTSAEKSRQRR